MLWFLIIVGVAVYLVIGGIAAAFTDDPSIDIWMRFAWPFIITFCMLICITNIGVKIGCKIRQWFKSRYPYSF